VSLLAEAPPGRHFAQLHRDSDTLVESAFAFVEAGVRSDHSVLVITTADQEQRLFDRLAADKLHPKSLCNSGQMAVLYSDEILLQLLKDGVQIKLFGLNWFGLETERLQRAGYL